MRVFYYRTIFLGFWMFLLTTICLPTHTLSQAVPGPENFSGLEAKQQQEAEKQALRREYAQLIAEQTNLRKAYLASTSESERASLLGRIQTLNFRIQLYEGRLQALVAAEQKEN